MAGVLSLVMGCTDGRRPPAPDVQITVPPTPPPRTELVPAAEVQFQGQTTEVLSMTMRGSSLFMTGRPFGFMRWDVGANAESPHLTFAASDQIDSFAPFGKWVVDWYASGGLSVLGPFAFMSGIVGVSVINISETHAPREIRRYPRENENSMSEQVIQDEAFLYKAIAAHPTRPILWGFREQDYLYTLQVGNGGTLSLLRKESYGSPGTTVCCVRGAAVWHNKLFVAFTQKLVYFDISPSGALTNAQELPMLQAYNVAATPNFLYVQHEPTYAQPSGVQYPRGIYVFDTEGNNVALLLTTKSPLKFAVTQNDSHILTNEDNTQVVIYRIQWAGAAGY